MPPEMNFSVIVMLPTSLAIIFFTSSNAINLVAVSGAILIQFAKLPLKNGFKPPSE